MEFLEEVDSSDNSPAFIVSNVIGVDALSEDCLRITTAMEDTNWSMSK